MLTEKQLPSHPHYRLVSNGKPCQPDMKQQMVLDPESTAHTGMEGQSRATQKYLLLQVWCGLLTVFMVVMAALHISVKPKSAEAGVSTLKPDNISQTVNLVGAPLISVGTASSYIQLIKSFDGHSWEALPLCESCSLILHDNSIYCKKEGIYFLYAQVTFRKQSSRNQTKSVILRTNAAPHKSPKTLLEGTFPSATEGSVWVAKMVNLMEGDGVSINISGDILKDNTFWGAYQIH